MPLSYELTLDQRDIMMISDRNFKILICFWVLASEDESKEGYLPDIDDMAFRLRMDVEEINQAIQELSDFLIHDDIKVISERYQDDAPETETETETETDKGQKVTLENLSIEHIQDWLADKRNSGEFINIDENAQLEKFKDYCLAKKPKYKDYVAALRNSFRWDNAPKKKIVRAQGLKQIEEAMQ